jgi:predicted permease
MEGMESFAAILAYLLIGIGVRRLPQFPEQTAAVLNLFVIHVSLPALVLRTVPGLEPSRALLAPALIPWAMLALTAAAVLVIARLRRWSREITGSLLLLAPLGNTSFLGIPMVASFLGEAAVPYAVIYDQLGTFLALATWGSVILALYGRNAERPTVATVLRKVAAFPPFLALLAAFALRPVGFHPVVAGLLEALAGTLVPVVMIAVGCQLRLRVGRDVVGPLAAGLGLKLVAAPLAALGICRALGVEGPAAAVSVFEAGMPPMISAGALALLAGLAPELSAALVGAGILLSFATLPALALLL